MRTTTSQWCVLAALATVACGSNNAGVPGDLLDAVRQLNVPQEGGAAAAYPPAPYGTKEGDVVQDLCFQGWTDPAKASYDPKKFSRICLSDFHDDPAVRVLLVESCAI